MDIEKFKHEMAKAKTFYDLGQDQNYWQGYLRGLRRLHHGENFGTKHEHKKWLSLINDPYRKEMGWGYVNGFNLNTAKELLNRN